MPENLLKIGIQSFCRFFCKFYGILQNGFMVEMWGLLFTCDWRRKLLLLILREHHSLWYPHHMESCQVKEKMFSLQYKIWLFHIFHFPQKDFLIKSTECYPKYVVDFIDYGKGCWSQQNMFKNFLIFQLRPKPSLKRRR